MAHDAWSGLFQLAGHAADRAPYGAAGPRGEEQLVRSASDLCPPGELGFDDEVACAAC